MKFTLSWLKHHLDTDASVADIAYALTDLGLEVEGIENPLERLADFTIGKVISALEEFSHPLQREDDVTLVIVKVQEL